MGGFVINTVTISGNLVRDPEVRSLPSGVSLCSLRVAVNERYKDNAGEWKDRPNFFDVSVWKGVGESIAKQLGKGDAVVVAGRLRWREWQDQNGATRQAVEIVADSAVPVPRDGQRSAGQSRTAASDLGEQMPATSAPPGYDDTDIPF